MEHLLSREDLEFQTRCQAYAREELRPLAKQLGEIDDVPEALRASLRSSGLYGPLYPKEYGGQGLSAVRICLAREALAGVFAPVIVNDENGVHGHGRLFSFCLFFF